MNEAGFWRTLKRTLHIPEAGQCAWKVGTSTRAGLPDVDYCIHGAAGKLELKYAERFPPRSFLKIRVTPEQRRHLDEWQACGGRAYVLTGVGQEWFLCRPDVPVEVTEDELRQLAVASGTFADIARLLVPTLIA